MTTEDAVTVLATMRPKAKTLKIIEQKVRVQAPDDIFERGNQSWTTYLQISYLRKQNCSLINVEQTFCLGS